MEVEKNIRAQGSKEFFLHQEVLGFLLAIYGILILSLLE